MLQLVLAHKTEILGGLFILEQALAQTKIVKANSTLQLLFSVFSLFKKKPTL